MHMSSAKNVATDGPYHRNGSIVSLSFCRLIAVTSTTFSFQLRLGNKKLDKGFAEGGRDAEGDSLRRLKDSGISYKEEP